MNKRWVIKERDIALEGYLSRELNINVLTSRILINRGIRDVKSGNEFLHISPSSLHDPFLINDMEKAVERIIKALHNKERILIFGDYDVDGVTATTVYMEFFKSFGAEVQFYIPDRMKEGYSLNDGAIQQAWSDKINLIITADCGTSSIGPVKLAQGLGIDIIVTDHHEPPEVLPEAYALLNPNRHDSNYPFKGLTGVGVAFKLINAISHHIAVKKDIGAALCHLSSNIDIFSFLDLVALGTIADVAPLTGENRYFVKTGLRLLTEEKRIGISALKDVSGIAGAEVNVGSVGFMLAPRINASGRLGSAGSAVNLLSSDDREEAMAVATYLDRTNQERQKVEAKIKDEVRELVLKDNCPENRKAIVLASKDWHQGVIGIVASKIVDEFYRPCILIHLQDNGIGKGSARSIPGFNIFEGLEGCKELLDRFGGHKYAAGLTVKESNISLLRDSLSSLIAERVKEEDFTPEIKMDAEISLDDISFPLLKELTLLPPYGISNPEPVIFTKGLTVLEPKVV
ncbi:MAG: single-stranded-DNA-specific exonuclease RecJ, partial [Nitrospira sp.]|nr:single-stranded-DNA-specific exonuclease RecJ [Nitrospira sp.]